MTGLFEVIASTDDIGPRAVIAAQTRAKAVFGRYAQDDASKLAFIDEDIKRLAAEVADEYGYDDADKLYMAATVALGGGHAPDCSCGFCENKGKLPGASDDESEEDEEKKEAKVAHSGDDCDCPAHDGGACNCGSDCDCAECAKGEKKESKVVTSRVLPEYDWEKTAADVETGDSYQQETMDMPSSRSGLGDTGAVPTDRAKSGDETGWNLEPIDVDSQKHQLEHQKAPERAEYNNADFDPGSPVRDRVNPETAIQPEYTNGPDTKTWSDKSTQADPVTSKWKLLT